MPEIRLLSETAIGLGRNSRSRQLLLVRLRQPPIRLSRGFQARNFLCTETAGRRRSNCGLCFGSILHFGGFHRCGSVARGVVHRSGTRLVWPGCLDSGVEPNHPHARFAPLRGGKRPCLTGARFNTLRMIRPGRRNGRPAAPRNRDSFRIKIHGCIRPPPVVLGRRRDRHCRRRRRTPPLPPPGRDTMRVTPHKRRSRGASLIKADISSSHLALMALSVDPRRDVMNARCGVPSRCPTPIAPFLHRAVA